MPGAGTTGQALQDPRITGTISTDRTETGTVTQSGTITASGTLNITGTFQIGSVTVGATAAEIDILDGATLSTAEINVLDGPVAGTVTASKALVVGASKELDILKIKTGSAAVGVGEVFGGGTDAAPLAHATAGHFIEFRTESTATSGTSRGLYFAHSSEGAGQDNDAIRIYARTRAALTGNHGAHISIDYDAGGSISGLGTAFRCTHHIPNRGLTGGNLAALSAEFWMDGSSSSADTTNASILRLGVNGDATGQGSVEYMLHLTAKEGSTEMIRINASAFNANMSGTIRCFINGAEQFIPLVAAEA